MLDSGSPPLPLSGIRVVDLTSSIAGPSCTQVLGALGADVIKVERPGGDDTRSWTPPSWAGESTAFLSVNANKRSECLDLKSPAGLARANSLIADADILIHSFRPGVAERLGLSFDEARRINPEIIYCAIGAFGSPGPLDGQPGYDPLMQAAAGIMSVTGEPDRAPVRVGVSIVDQGTGLWMAIGILAALRVREARGGAQLVDTSLFETALAWMPQHILAYLASGEVPSRMGSALGILAPYEAFATTNGRIVVAAGNDSLFGNLCEVLEVPELASLERFATNADRVGNRDELHGLLAERLAGEPSETWLRRLGAAGVPVAPILDVAEAVEHPQTEALGMLQSIEHPIVEDLRLVALPLSLNGERIQHRSPPPPLPGAERSGP